MDENNQHHYPPNYPNVNPEYRQFLRRELEGQFEEKLDSIHQAAQERIANAESEWMKALRDNQNREAILEGQVNQLRRELEAAQAFRSTPIGIPGGFAPHPSPNPTAGLGTGVVRSPLSPDPPTTAHFPNVQPTDLLSPRAQPTTLLSPRVQPTNIQGAPLSSSLQPGQPSAVSAIASDEYQPPTYSVATRKLAEHQLPASDVPKGAAKLKESLELHIRMLWRHLDATSKPPAVDPSQLAEFNARFSNDLNESDLARICSSSQPLILPSLVQVQSSIPVTIAAAQSRILSGARRLEEFVLEYIQATVSKFGLTFWCPDMTQTAGSVYNSACRIIALDTFRQAVASQQYRLGPAEKFLKNMPLLISIYNNFVHYRMRKTFDREMLYPGKTKQLAGNNPAYQNRARLCRSRREFVKANGYKRYLKYLDPKSTSDDEADPQGSRRGGRPIHFIKTRRERSAGVNALIRLLDEERELVAMYEGKTYRQERIRIFPENPVHTAFPLLPFNTVPLDYYDPAFFNSLQPGTRKKIAGPFPIVGLLPNASHSFGHRPNGLPHPDEKLGQKAFNAKYREQVLMQYRLDDLDDIDFVDSEEEDDDGTDEYEMEEESEEEGEVEQRGETEQRGEDGQRAEGYGEMDVQS